MAFAQSVQIGPQFFLKAKNDYADWRWAIIREFMQNSIDCGSRYIDIIIKLEGDNTRLIVANDGSPMDENELVDKLLALGESGKDFVGTVGGFGKAKEILYFCHLGYQIRTGSFRVVGSGAGYNLEDAAWFHGTESSILIEGDEVEELINRVKRYAAECQWRGELSLNSERLDTNLRKGSRRRDLGWAVIYTNKTFPHRLIVRIDGMPMFSRYVNIDRCVLVEVNRSSKEALTSNRDGLVSEYRHKLEAWVDELTTDESTALRDEPTISYHYFQGEKQQHSGANAEAVQELVTAAYATIPQPIADPEEETPTLGVDRPVAYDDGPSTPRERSDFMTPLPASCSYEFIVKNTTGLQVLTYYMPYGFSSYARKLATTWIKCLLELHRFFGIEGEFSVGFVLHDKAEAQYEENERYGRVYYINPTVVVEQSCSRSRSLKKRWKFNNAGNYAILATAVHEILHGMGYHPHDEAYASKLTDLMGTVMANKRRFHSCFR